MSASAAWRSTEPSALCGLAGAASDAETGAGSGMVAGSGMGDRLLRDRARGLHQPGHGSAPVLGSVGDNLSQIQKLAARGQQFRVAHSLPNSRVDRLRLAFIP